MATFALQFASSFTLILIICYFVLLCYDFWFLFIVLDVSLKNLKYSMYEFVIEI